MADNNIMMIEYAPARTCKRKPTIENTDYLMKIEELANTMLIYFRDKELGIETSMHEAPGPRTLTTNNRKLSTSACEDIGGKKKKKRKVTKQVVRTPVVVNDVTEGLKEFVPNVLKGNELTLVIQKILFKSDTKKVLNRLNMPIIQLESDKFLTEGEKRVLDRSEGEIEVRVLGPTLEMYENTMKLRKWRMSSTENYVLTTNWYRFRSKNKLRLKITSKIQVWAFRGADQRLCFAVVCVEEPEVETLDSDS
ncbi:putative B3 domain-containing protein At2g27410 [Bidens hawaiensis]|uniref:putative B3 domain-containing protein At2g27410 n=1 Tax=Bidens hawaiensis TaxID=980011 RepID=UPI00404B5402